jgi:hypothetical protein
MKKFINKTIDTVFKWFDEPAIGFIGTVLFYATFLAFGILIGPFIPVIAICYIVYGYINK